MKKIIGFLATLTFILTLFMAGNMVVEAAEGAGITSANVQATDTTDTQPPTVTKIEKITEYPIFTSTSVDFNVTYSDEQSDVEKITLRFVDKSTGKIILEGSVSNDTTPLGQSGTVKISILSNEQTRDAIGTFKVKDVIISDVSGNSRTYGSSNIYSGGDVTFERLCNYETARITKVKIKEGTDIDNVNPGSSFNLELSFNSNSYYAFFVNNISLQWVDPTTENDEVIKENIVSINKSITIPSYTSSKVVTIPIQIEDNETCGSRVLRKIILKGSTNSKSSEIILEKKNNGKLRQYVDNDRTPEPTATNISADFTIHRYESAITPATPTKDGAVEDKCTLCHEVRSTTEIPHPENITLSSTEFVYNGNVQTPTVTVTDSTGKEIPSTEYTVTYANGRVAAGQYDVTITFKNNYSGTVTRTFTIKNPQTPPSSDSNGGNGASSTNPGNNTPSSSNSTVNNTSSSSATNNTIVPTIKGTKISSAKSAAKKITVKWKKQTKNTSGYQIQYSLKKTFKSGVKTKTIKKNKTTSVVLKKLKSKKTYYIRIRTYQNTSGGTYYSTWSPVKKIKVK